MSLFLSDFVELEGQRGGQQWWFPLHGGSHWCCGHLGFTLGLTLRGKERYPTMSAIYSSSTQITTSHLVRPSLLSTSLSLSCFSYTGKSGKRRRKDSGIFHSSKRVKKTPADVPIPGKYEAICHVATYNQNKIFITICGESSHCQNKFLNGGFLQ